MVEYTLGKKERLNSKTLIERLFSGGSKSFPAFPLRVVYMSVEPVEEDMAAASILEEQAFVAGCAGFPEQKTDYRLYMAG